MTFLFRFLARLLRAAPAAEHDQLKKPPDTGTRPQGAILHPSGNCFALIKHYEGCSLVAYPDPGTGGEPITIGWGQTYKGLKLGDKISQEAADQLLESTVATFAGDVRAAISAGMRQEQFDAMVCLAYNIGVGAFSGSTLVKLFNAGDIQLAADQFPRWDKAGGKSLKGLRKRRAAERALFLGANAAYAIAAGDKTP